MDTTVKERVGRLVTNNDDMTVCLNAIHQSNRIIYDVETSGLDPRRNHAVGYVITVGPRPSDTFYVPVRHGGGGNCLNWQGLDEPEQEHINIHPFEEALAQEAMSRDRTVIGHNLGFDLLMSAAKGITWRGRMECTQAAMALINEHLPSFSLENCARYMQVTPKLGHDLYQHLANLYGGEPSQKQMANFWRLAGNNEIAVDYACGDGVATWELRGAQQVQLELEELSRVWDVECRVTKTLFRMERRGIRIDTDAMERLADWVAKTTEEARKALPNGINVNSGPQLRAMFDKAGISNYPITALGNPSFAVEWLESNELGQKVIAVRKLVTLQDRFIAPIIEKHLYKGRVYPHYNQLKHDDFGTISGRLSCTDPNIQQVYKRDARFGRPFRRIFVPDDDMTWSSNDYSQCEPRIYSEYTNNELLKSGYLSDPPVDFYQTLSNITGIPRSSTPGIAGNCKQLALALFYGAGIPKTASMLGVTTDEATRIRQMVYQMIPEIPQFTKDAKRAADARGYVKTILGRRCRFPTFTTNRFSGRSEREFSHKATSRIVQGGNADLIKLALVEVDDYLESVCCLPPIATVHDSIECQYPIGRDDINDEVVNLMEATAKGPLINFDIPQRVDNGVGQSWDVATYGEEQ